MTAAPSATTNDDRPVNGVRPTNWRRSVRAVLEAAGVTDVLTKSLGTNNPINVVRATMDGLTHLVTAERVAEERGISVHQLGAVRHG
jgi:hypothetical protein